MPRAILGLIDVISIDCRLGVVAPPPLLPPQPLKASSLNRSAAPVDFDTTNELRDERVKKLPIMSPFRCGLRLFSFLRRESLKTTSNLLCDEIDVRPTPCVMCRAATYRIRPS